MFWCIFFYFPLQHKTCSRNHRRGGGIVIRQKCDTITLCLGRGVSHQGRKCRQPAKVRAQFRTSCTCSPTSAWPWPSPRLSQPSPQPSPIPWQHSIWLSPNHSNNDFYYPCNYQIPCKACANAVSFQISCIHKIFAHQDFLCVRAHLFVNSEYNDIAISAISCYSVSDSLLVNYAKSIQYTNTWFASICQYFNRIYILVVQKLSEERKKRMISRQQLLNIVWWKPQTRQHRLIQTKKFRTY